MAKILFHFAMSANVGKLIVTALISYVATNADDLIVLMNFFTEASMENSKLKVRHIFIGQYIGFFILLAISLVGYLVSFILPIEMLGFLGFVPILIGVKHLIELIIELYKNRHGTIDDILPVEPISTVELVMVRYRKDSITYELKKQDEQQQLETVVNRQGFQCLRHIITLETLKVISITVANSGDNIAIYTPLFAQAYQWEIAVYIIIYLVMVFVWLVFSYYFINYRPVLDLAQKYARYIVPVVFIGIGIYIIVSSECFPWLIEAIKTKNFKNG